jgi:hypothetical protein
MDMSPPSGLQKEWCIRINEGGIFPRRVKTRGEFRLLCRDLEIELNENIPLPTPENGR